MLAYPGFHSRKHLIIPMALRLPLAARMCPQELTEFHGQTHLLAPGKPLRIAIESGKLYSMILWGPPGSGKTSLAKLMASYIQAEFIHLSAVLIGVPALRVEIKKAELARETGRKTVLFLDEIHRFNKAQQDALLPYVENGTVILIGATTENPSFEINNALLSRARVHRLQSLTENDLVTILKRALSDENRGLAAESFLATDQQLTLIAQASYGDARIALSYLEILSDLAEFNNGKKQITDKAIAEVLCAGIKRFDKQGDIFYDQISALHKSVRGSSPDGALYWLTSMLNGGCDPIYLARRIVRMASEDIGNADPRALQLALNAWEVQERLGSPDGELALAQAVIYLACAPKSNAAYCAFLKAQSAIQQQPENEVPMHLRNAPTALMKQSGFGMGYRYDHDEPDAYAAGQTYFPDALGEQQYYFPVPRGLEIKIQEKLAELKSRKKKY